VEHRPHRWNPYVGPRSFERGETLYGRDREVGELLDLLIAERIVLLYSPSGAGKTSLIQAALIPVLEEEGFRPLPVMRVSRELPPDVASIARNRYISSLLLSLEENVPQDRQLLDRELAAMILADYFDRCETGTDADESSVLIFDQFEEILTMDPTDQSGVSSFFAEVGAALRNRDRWALFSMREDFLARLDPYLRLIPTRFATTYRLDLLDEPAARQAVGKPAIATGIDFTEAAIVKLLDDLRRVRVQQPNGETVEQLGQYIEPVQIQVICRRLWENIALSTTRIEEADVLNLGDVDATLADYYAERAAGLAAETGVAERTLRDWIDEHLITDQGIRGQVLQGPERTKGLDNRAIQGLVDAHLLRAEKRRGATWFELAHDRLIEPVQNNNALWRERNLSALQRQAALWQEQGKQSGFLLSDRPLADAERWAQSHATELKAIDSEFLVASRQAADARDNEQRQLRRIRSLMVVVGLVSIVAVITSIVATRFYLKAEAETDKVLIREISKHARNLVGVKPSLSLLLAITAYSRSRSAGGIEAVQTEELLRGILEQVGGIPLRGLDGPLSALAVSPTGRWLATAGRDHRLRLWDLGSKAPWRDATIIEKYRGTISTMVFSPDGRWLATGSSDTVAHLLDLSASSQNRTSITLHGHTAAILVAAFSPDGRWLATGSADSTVRLWDMSGDKPGRLATVLNHNRVIKAISFSGDGHWLATGSLDGTVSLSDITGSPAGIRTQVLGRYQAPVLTMSFDPDSRLLATGNGDGSGMACWRPHDHRETMDACRAQGRR